MVFSVCVCVCWGWFFEIIDVFWFFDKFRGIESVWLILKYSEIEILKKRNIDCCFIFLGGGDGDCDEKGIVSMGLFDDFNVIRFYFCEYLI